MKAHCSPMARSLRLAFLIAGAYLATGSPSVIAGTVVPLDTGHSLAIVLRSDKPAHERNADFVSLASIDAYIVVADYGTLYCLDTTRNFLKVVVAPQSLSGKWMPTGVFYHRTTGRLYVANYLGNNIIEGALDCKKGVFTMLGQIASVDTVSPENIVVSADGSALYSANYDGDNVSAFRREAGRWVPLWTQHIAQAHGIATRGNDVYATSLLDRTLFRLDAQTGKVLVSSGRMGTEAWNTEFLWPTALLELHGAMFVSDAHTGYVCSFDRESLRTKDCFGGYGPGAGRFNMPYGIAEWSKNGRDAILVASTFSSRITEILLPRETAQDNRQQGMSVYRDWYWTGGSPINVEYLREWPLSALRVVGIPSNPRSSVCAMPIWLPGMTCEYGTLVSESRRKVLQFPNSRSIVEPLGQIYFIESFEGHDAYDTYFLSPQNLQIVNLRTRLGVPFFLTETLTSIGNFFKNEKLISTIESVTQESVIAVTDEMFNALQALRDAHGVIPPTAAAGIFAASSGGAEQFHERMRKALHKFDDDDRFFRTYASYDGDPDTAGQLRKLALELAGNELQAKDVLIDVLIIPCMLTNARCSERIWKVLASANRPLGLER